MLSDQEKRAVREEVERLVDQAFLKLHGKTYRTSNPSSNGDALGQIKRDFPSLFKDPE